MRMTTEACNNISMSTGLRGRVFQYPTKLWRGLSDKLLGERDCAIHVREFLGMSQWKEKEGLLPWSGKRIVVTDLHPFERKREGFRILCERARRISVK